MSPTNVTPLRTAKPSSPARWSWQGTDDLFDVRPPPEWTVRDLGICPGRPALFSGPSGGAKTLFVQSLELALVAGRPLLECFPALPRPLRVVHIDVDLGRDDLAYRYRRLIAGWPGRRLTREDIGDRLKRISYPEPGLDLHRGDEARDLLRRELAPLDADLVVIDALRGVTSADENSSVVRSSLDACAAVSNDLRLAFLILHHTGKDKFDTSGRLIEDTGLGRGSSAIKDGAGVGLRISGSREKGRRLAMIKPPGRTGVEWTDSYDVQIVGIDVDDPSVENSGLRVQLVPHVEREAGAVDDVAAQLADQGREVRAAIHAVLRNAPAEQREGSAFRLGIDTLAKNAATVYRQKTNRRLSSDFARNIARIMVAEGSLIVTGAGPATRLRLGATSPEPTSPEPHQNPTR